MHFKAVSEIAFLGTENRQSRGAVYDSTIYQKENPRLLVAYSSPICRNIVNNVSLQNLKES